MKVHFTVKRIVRNPRKAVFKSRHMVIVSLGNTSEIEWRIARLRINVNRFFD
jgi:hypothetical protein